MIPKRLREEIEDWMDSGRYGHLQINFAGGKIVNVNRVESLKVEAIGFITTVTSTTQTTPKSIKLE